MNKGRKISEKARTAFAAHTARIQRQEAAQRTAVDQTAGTGRENNEVNQQLSANDDT